MSALSVVATVVGIAVGAGGLGATMWAIIRTRGIQLTLDLIVTGNTELRAENERLHKTVADERVECAREIAAMDGKLQVLTDGLAERIVSATIAAMQGGRRASDASGG